MGVFFISMKGKKVSVKCNVCFVSVPFGDLFCFYENHEDVQADSNSGFRPLWGAFLFLSCPMETLAGIEKTCTLRCKKFSPVKSGDSKLVNCSDP